MQGKTELFKIVLALRSRSRFAMMAMTTSNSINVNPNRLLREHFIMRLMKK
jgi:hypothetical protein